MSPCRKAKPRVDASPLSEAIELVFRTNLPDRPGNPSLRDYYGDLRQPAQLERYVRYHNDMLRFADFDPSGMNVLEVGSGFGLVLVWLAWGGARAPGVEV